MITYNTSKVKAEDAPKKWTDLLDPKWKGKVSTGHPGFSGYVGTWVLMMKNLYGWDYFDNLEKNKPQIGRSINDTVTALNAGERQVAAGADGSTLFSASRGNPLADVYPSDGSVLIIAPSAIIKGTKHPNAAKLFMEYLNSIEAAKINAKHFAIPLRPGSAAAAGRQADQRGQDDPPERRGDRQGHPRGDRAVAGYVRELMMRCHALLGARHSSGADLLFQQQMTRRLGVARPQHMTVAAPSFATTPARRARVGGFDATWLLWIAIIAVLLFLVVSPFVYLVVTSFTAERTGGFTFANYGVAWGRARYVEALFNSLQLGAVSAGLAGLFAIPLAWGVSRTNMPGRGFVRMLVLATFITPPYTGAVAWILLAGPNAGWLNRFYMFATGAEAGPFNIYSFTGLAVVIALYSFPYIFIFTSAALELVSSEMEDAANILGAGTWRTMRRVTLPLALPAILGGLIICFLEAIALFASPAMIAIPARFNVATTQLFQFFGNPGAGRGGGGLCHAAARRHRDADPGAAPDDPSQGLRLAHRQGRRTAADPARPLALGDVRLRHVRGDAVGLPAVSVPAAGRVRQGLGPRLRARQPLVPEFPLRSVRACDRGASR